ncbi:conserved hypothetical protein [Trichinella spiralis]|uniref:hypothetical protein n=1 Tax=Trichinella spiralis TaxID=6334 RepID=UPI0001EFE6AD|nr:conserved hypothetical protein [Trichinella spiralis]
MLNPDFERFDSFVCSWNSCQKLWFILVDDGKYLDSRLGLEEKKPDSSSGPSLASIESKSRLMGLASRNAHHNITNVISAPNFKCITAAAGFIRVEYHHHPHLQLEKRLATTMESMKEKFAGAWDNIVVVFVHDSLKSDLESIVDKTPKPLELPMGDAEASPENNEENKT